MLSFGLANEQESTKNGRKREKKCRYTPAEGIWCPFLSFSANRMMAEGGGGGGMQPPALEWHPGRRLKRHVPQANRFQKRSVNVCVEHGQPSGDSVHTICQQQDMNLTCKRACG